MNAFTLYLLEASVCLGVFYLFYLAVLHRQPTFHYNRVYLLATSALGWILPLLEVPFGWGGGSPVGEGSVAYLLLPAVEGEATESLSTGLPWWEMIYGLGVLIVLTRFAGQCYRLHKIVRSSSEQMVPHRRYRLLYTNGRFPTASFFRYLFWDNTQSLSVEETRQMMLHEDTHIRQGHSYDTMYLALLKVLAWFHPLVYLYERALIQTHEFAADAGVLRQVPAAQRSYARLLSKHTLSSRNVLLVNRFFYPSLILNRIHMIYANSQKTPWYRYVLIVPVFASLFFAFACQPDEEEVTREAVAQSYGDVIAQLETVDNQIRDLQARTFGDYPTALNNRMQSLEKQGIPINEETLTIGLWEEEASSSTAQLANSLIARQKELREQLQSLPDADGVYTVVENRPEPKGGMSAYYKQIGDNIRYPQAARRAGTEGKVFVQFVVDEYGQLTDSKVLKGIGGGCDEEALRVIQEAPEWVPGNTNGQAVNVRMVLPIMFKLDRLDAPASLRENTEDDRESVAKKKSEMEEMVVVGYQ